VIAVCNDVQYVLAKLGDDHQQVLQQVSCPRSSLLPAAVDHQLRVSLVITVGWWLV